MPLRRSSVALERRGSADKPVFWHKSQSAELLLQTAPRATAAHFAREHGCRPWPWTRQIRPLASATVERMSTGEGADVGSGGRDERADRDDRDRRGERISVGGGDDSV